LPAILFPLEVAEVRAFGVVGNDLFGKEMLTYHEGFIDRD
jgi:hypothetical protein